MRPAILSSLVMTAVVLVPAAARADGPRFGGAGQLAVSDDQPLGSILATGIAPVPPSAESTASFQFASVSDNGGSGTSFVVAPAADYFVIGNLSLGANILFGLVSPAHGNTGNGISETLFGIAPRVGYNIPISDSLSFWPKVFFGYTTVSSSGGSTVNGVSTNPGFNSTGIGVFAPLMIDPAPHFFLGIGPNFSTQFSSNQTSGSASQSLPKVTQVGLQMTLGGWSLGD